MSTTYLKLDHFLGGGSHVSIPLSANRARLYPDVPSYSRTYIGHPSDTKMRPELKY